MKTKLDFIQGVFKRFGVLVWFEGPAPDKLAAKTEHGERETFKQWCARVLERTANDVTVLTDSTLAPNRRMAAIADTELAAVVKDLLRARGAQERGSQQRLGSAAAASLRETRKKLKAARAELAQLHEEHSQEKLRKLQREDNRLLALLDTDLGEFLDGDGANLDPQVKMALQVFRNNLGSKTSLAGLVSNLALFAHQTRLARIKAEQELVQAHAESAELRYRLEHVHQDLNNPR